MQAGVDLGSVRADQENERKRRGKGKKQALPQAQLRPKRRAPISQVLLVGGGTRMPAMRRFVHNMTGLEPATFVQPDEVQSTVKLTMCTDGTFTWSALLRWQSTRCSFDAP